MQNDKLKTPNLFKELFENIVVIDTSSDVTKQYVDTPKCSLITFTGEKSKMLTAIA